MPPPRRQTRPSPASPPAAPPSKRPARPRRPANGAPRRAAPPKPERLYRTIIEAARDSIFVVGPDLRVRFVNPSAAAYMRRSATDILGRSVAELFPPDVARRQTAALERVFATGEPQYSETPSVFGQAVVWLDTWLVPVRDAGGRISEVVGFSRDATERKRFEDEQRRSQKLESLGVLAGGIAHDFNNLLTAVMGNLGLAKMCPDLPEEAYERVQEAETAMLRAKDLTRQLLAFAKGGAPMRRDLPVPGLVREAATFSLRGSKTRCLFRFPDGLWPIHADEGQVSQVVSNLVINADQAMPQGGNIEVSADNVVVPDDRQIPVGPGRYVCIAVEDQGPGIPPERLSRIFDPYFTTKEDGSGLGLTTARTIVKNHHGHLEVDSLPGSGTTLRVYLPAAVVVPAEREPSGAGRGPAGDRGRVLVMDDQPPIREVTRRMLRQLGCEVAVADSGEEAVDVYRRERAAGHRFDLVLMDLTVPGAMGGREAAERILALDPGARVVVSSGYTDDPVMTDFRRYGFCDLVVKPYQTADLAAVLTRVLGTKGSDGRDGSG